jgi:choline dehydrogenase
VVTDGGAKFERHERDSRRRERKHAVPSDGLTNQPIRPSCTKVSPNWASPRSARGKLPVFARPPVGKLTVPSCASWRDKHCSLDGATDRRQCPAMLEADIIIVGAGSAGCAVAGRLARTTPWRILLVEAGGPDRNIWLRIPAGYYRTAYSPRFSWNLKTVPQPSLGGRVMLWPRGRVLGGSSAINGLVYIRGQPADFRRWRASGCVGWDWEDVLPLFRRAETHWAGESAYHGGGGPLHVSPIPMRHRLLDRFIETALRSGIPANSDFNGASQEGVGYFDLTTERGLRCSSSRAYLRAPLPDTLRILGGCEAQRIGFENGHARTLDVVREGSSQTLRAHRAIIVCSGAVGSPALLWRSGIGEGQSLMDAGLEVQHDNPGVGANLQDHYQVKLSFEVDGRDSYNLIAHNVWRRAVAGLQFVAARTGPLAASGGQVGLFARADPESIEPDVQFHVSPQSSVDPARGLDRYAGFTIGVCKLRPESRGAIRFARSAAPERFQMMAEIDPAYLTAQTDVEVTTRGLRLGLAIAGTDPFRQHVVKARDAVSATSEDEDFANFSRQYGNTVYHPAGTCRMGDDEASVVDPGLRVRGAGSLYVADASIMPALTSGNTNAPSIMIGEKAADLVTAHLRA